MRHLSFLEKVFLRRLVESGGELEIGEDYDHREWDKLVKEGFVDRHAAGHANGYVITEKGRTALSAK